MSLGWLSVSKPERANAHRHATRIKRLKCKVAEQRQTEGLRVQLTQLEESEDEDE